MIRAAVLHRSDEAFAWLVGLVAEERAAIAAIAIESLSIYKHNAQLASRLRGAVRQRRSKALTETLDKFWDVTSSP